MRFKSVLAIMALVLGYAAMPALSAGEQSQGAPTQRNIQQSGQQSGQQSASQSAQARAPHRSHSSTIDPAVREVITRQYVDYLLVDKSDRTLVAFSKGKPIRTYNGLRFGDAPRGHKRFEGDERTPEGLYYIDARNPDSSFHLSLRVSYPNNQDRAFAAQYGRSAGGDIFIHGQPNGYRGSPIKRDWTDGCIALSNAEITELWKLVPDGTPIRIRP